MRPLNCLITAVSVLVGAWIGLPRTLSLTLYIAMTAGFSACAYGNIINDIFDMKIDVINAPDRPLPRGSVKKNHAIIEAIILAIISQTLAIMISFKASILVMVALILLFFYAALLKKYWPANLIVAILAGFSFLLGGVTNNNFAALFPFVFSILIHMPREIIKDLIDEDGDRKMGIITCAARVGSQRARNIAAAYLGLLCLVLPSPFIFQILNWRYMVLIIFVAIPLILYLIIRIVMRSAITDLRPLSRFFKLIMVTGLIAMIV